MAKFSNIYDYYGHRILEEYHDSFPEHVFLPPKDPQQDPQPETEGEGASKVRQVKADVAIIGAGAAGMYAALIIQLINEVFPHLKVTYEILEASDRVGGRLYTYEFPDSPDTVYDYYDVGAMRFPKTPYMERTFQLFRYLGLDKTKLIPYKFVAKNTILYYNGLRVLHQDIATQDKDDPFHVTRANGGDVPDDWASDGYEPLLDSVLSYFTSKLVKDMKDGGRTGWHRLMQYDDLSMRGYLSTIQKYPTTVINWLETRDTSTGSYETAFSEAVLDAMAFNFPEKDPPKTDEDINKIWHCIDGGTKVIADAMEKKLKTPVEKNTRVTAISLENPRNPRSYVLVTTLDNKPLPSDHPAASTSKDFSASRIKEATTRAYKQVICTAPLPVVRAMNTDGLYLDYGQSNALRELEYGPSTKIGMKFRSRWWEKKFQIYGGQSYSDRPIRTVVYPSYGMGEDGTGSIIVSYAWTMDALRLGSLMQGNGSAEKAQLIDLVLRDLAAIHDLDYAYLQDQLLDTYPYNWYGNPLTMGAFAFFGPGQFKKVYRNLTRPAANGKVHFAGEALSTRHAWVVGALDSAHRAVFHFYLEKIREDNKWKEALEFLKNDEFFGLFGEWKEKHLERQVAISRDIFRSRLARQEF